MLEEDTIRMDETWSDPGITSQDLQEFLQALALSEQQNAPLIAVAGDATGKPHLVAASQTLFRLFDVTDPAGLSARLLTGGDPGGKRLAVLFQMLPLEGAPRVERLRFLIGPSSEIITFLCRRLAVRGRNVLIAAALGLRPGLIPVAASETSPPADSEQVASAAQPASNAMPETASESDLAPQPAIVRDAARVRDEIRQKWRSAKTLRFLWHTDADAVCTLLSPPLAEAVGARAADLVGKNMLDLASSLDPSGGLAQRLDGRETWSGLGLQWPVAEAAATIPVVMGAVPAFRADQSFDGFRGFGVIHLDGVTDAPVPQAPAAAESEALEPPEMPETANVLPFPAARVLTTDEQTAFEKIGEVLRTEDAVPAEPATPESVTPAAPPAEEITAAVPAEAKRSARPNREEHPGQNGITVLDKLSLGLLVSRNNVPIFANRYLLDMLGFKDEDALHDAGGMTHLFGGLPGNATGSEAVGIRGSDGTVRAANARMQAVEWDGLPATLLTLKEIASPARAEREAETHRQHESELRELRAILETATDGVAVLDANGNVVSLNRSGEALFGCDRTEVIGEPFLTLFAPHNRSLASDYFEGLKSSATKSLLNDGREILVKAHRGGTIPVFMTLGKLGPSDVGSPGGASPDETRYCALFRDLTHWKKVEQELDHARQDAERTSALKSDFLAKVSHEVRTPLNAIIGFAEVIMEERFGPVGNARYKDYLKDIHTSGKHVMSLINDLLDLSKIEAGKMELHATAIDANKIIMECTGIMQPQASQERVIMRLSLAPNLPRIKADERSLRQIVLNLLSNAVKFNEPGGQVIIATTLTDAGHVVIRIRDTGPGMSDQDIETALEPFRQLATSRPMTAGTGLGLPLTKALVEANHASFTLRSKLEQGTLAEVAFPPALVLAD
ncbi:MAG: PAS domain-containing sensor histidine kinase [Beijerinckiaceae bacterium]|nr:PAS domain-containing sensor histidine kinase [Beijerinckiaceae bacterium]